MDNGNQVFATGGSAALLVLEFPSFRDFIDAYSPIISEEGIFIRNDDISESNAFAVNDRVDFEVRLKDDFRLIQGSGEVVWLGASQAAGGATGTAIRFHDVDEPSQRLIARLVGNYVRDGGALFELGEPRAEGASSVAEESGDLSGLVASPPLSQLTAENLMPSEADELFSDDGEADATPLEFESVSLEDVRDREEEGTSPGGGADEPDAAVPRLEDPVGLDTIAIPSGLVAELSSRAEAPASPDETGTHEGPEEHAEAEELPTPMDLSALDDSLPAADAAHPSALDPMADFSPPPVAPPVEEEVEQADEGSLEAVAESFDESLGSGGIPDNIVQVAEELSGVHRFDLPDNEETGGVDYAGSASVRADRNTGGRIAALSVVFVLLGAGAFYFGDSILSSLGLGGDAGNGGLDEVVLTGEAMPAQAPTAGGDSSPEESSDATSVAEGGRSGDKTPAGTGSEGAPEVDVASTEESTPQTASPAENRQETGGEITRPATADRAAGIARAGAAPPRNVVGSAAAAGTRRVERITWSEQGDETVVTIRLNSELTQDLVKVVRVRDGAPREVIKIRGVDAPYSPREVAIGSAHVLRLRTGLHRNASGSELHVVADLAGAGVTVLSIEPKGRDLVVTFA